MQELVRVLRQILFLKIAGDVREPRTGASYGVFQLHHIPQDIGTLTRDVNAWFNKSSETETWKVWEGSK